MLFALWFLMLASSGALALQLDAVDVHAGWP